MIDHARGMIENEHPRQCMMSGTLFVSCACGVVVKSSN